MQVLGRYAESPYREVIDEFWGEVCELQDEDENWQMERPEVWAEASGWTRYELREGRWLHIRVPFPDAKVIVFDVETAPGIEGECIVGEQVGGNCPDDHAIQGISHHGSCSIIPSLVFMDGTHIECRSLPPPLQLVAEVHDLFPLDHRLRGPWWS